MSAMTYEEFQRQLGKAGMSVKEFAGLLGMNRNSITNCSARGEIPSHLAVISVLMAEMAEHQIDFRSALARIEIVPKRPRGAGAKGKFGGSPQEPPTLSLD
ncbi:XRE family transcriptional regulator [Pseudomonas sp. MM227]|uniref:XRE family transcriptional regulator n=1 Tax=Pseudomonas sp. MM227 TaxID=3019968 RepID=UPI0022208A40|nr:XRE family transcriptional regulator [Pseudomonas sp. MM227]